jgi:hypothetical protein
LLDAPAYARSLLRLANSASFLTGSHTLSAYLKPTLLEERIMKLIERRPCMSKRGKTFILAAVLSLLATSNAFAAVFSLNIVQSAKEQGAKTSLKEKIIGEWIVSLDTGNGYVEGEATGPVLIVKANGDRLTGKIIAPGSSGMEWPLIEPRFDGEKFIIKGEDDNGEVFEGYVKLTNDQFEGPWKQTAPNGHSASGRMKLTRRS